jgi:hypothetical protein
MLRDEREARAPPAERREIGPQHVELSQATEKTRGGLRTLAGRRPQDGDQICRARCAEPYGRELEPSWADRPHRCPRGQLRRRCGDAYNV